MKKILIFLIFTSLVFPSKASDTLSIKFTTLGNCYLCKLRIEASLVELDGVTDSDWDYYTAETSVSYLKSLTDPHEIMRTIAKTGHDTEWYEAPDSAYNTLKNTCCEYLRTIDYDSVQIGYFSLMQIWETQLSVNILKSLEKVKIYPTVTYGNVNIVLPDNNFSYFYSVFSLSGEMVLTGTIRQGTTQVDISDKQAGTYIINIWNEKGNSISKKIIRL